MATEKQKSNSTRDLRKELANRLVQLIAKGEASWQRPWVAGEFLAPENAITGKPYRGVNRVNLMTFSPDNSDPRWCTYNQAKEAGWQVRKGSVGVPIEVWKSYDHKRTPEEMEAIKNAIEESNNPIMQNEEIAEKEQRLMVRYYTVFHASQIDGIPALNRPELDRSMEGKPDQRLPILAENMGVAVTHSGSMAFYRPLEDRVNVPEINRFETAAGYDTTLLHELSHATGHEKRLNREGITNLDGFGSQSYAMEELIAEMSAAMTAASLGIGFDPKAQDMEENREMQNTAAYLASWLQALPEKDREKAIINAINKSQETSDYLIKFAPELVLDQTKSQDNKQEEDSNFFVEEPNDDKENNVKLNPQEEIDYFLN